MGGVETTSGTARRRSDATFAVVWHAGIALVIAVAMGALAARGWLPVGPTFLALSVAGAAALVGALLSVAGKTAQAGAIVVWALAAAAACHLTGGASGPLAAWCLAPAAAATAFRDREHLALGAAAALAAAALSTLGAVLLGLPQPPAPMIPWLGLLALGTVTLGFAAGLVGLQGAIRRDARRNDEAARIFALMQGQPLLLALIEPGGRIQIAAGASLGGPLAAQLEGVSIGNLVAEDDLPALAQALHTALRTGQASVFVASAADPEGPIEITLRAAGEGRLVAALRDAREQRQRERRLEAERFAAEQQNAGKSRFLANMSHELRTPLNAIMGFSDIMRQRLFGPLGDRYAEYSELIHESGTHLLELINDVLDMSKIEAERFELAIETFDARDAVAAVLRLMRGQAERAGVSLRGVLPVEPLAVAADRRALKQIALNLVSNALKFTPGGGSVTVTLHTAGSILEIVVADTGVGIAQNDLQRLGRPFEQAGDAEQRAAGSGLGLSLVRAFARLHGGEMSVESAMGEGTTVTVRMPVVTNPADLGRRGR